MLPFRPRSVPPTLRRLLHSTPCPDEVGPLACRLGSRSVLKFDGPDTIKFLHGLLTNDVRRLAVAAVSEQGGSGSSHLPTSNVSSLSLLPVYSVMLTPHGRFLYDFFLYRPSWTSEKLDRMGSGPGSDGLRDALFADVDATVVDELLDCLKKYRLRAKVEIENVTGEFSCWQRFGGNLDVDSSSVQEPKAAAVGWGGGTDHVGASSAQANNFGWRWYKDPRLNCLGFRGIFPSEMISPLVESDRGMDEQYYVLWRLERGVAEGSVEIPKGDAIPFEYNLTGLNAISFEKGCYVGQEFVARTHHRGVIRKRLVPLKFTNDSGSEVEQKVAPGTEVVEATSSKKVGSVTAALGSLGMGVLRLDNAFKSSLGIKDEPELKVKVTRPDWWPAEWAPDLQQETASA